MQPQIRKLVESDKERWLVLWQGYLDFYKTVLTAQQTEQTWNRFFDSTFNSFALVAEGNGGVVGFTHYSFQTSTWSDGGYCYLEDLFVDSTKRGSGVGRALIDAVKAIAIASNCTRLYWNTDSDNETARALYDTYTENSGKVQYRIELG